MPAVNSSRKSRDSRSGVTSIRTRRRRSRRDGVVLTRGDRRTRGGPGARDIRPAPAQRAVTRILAPSRGTLVMLRTFGRSSPSDSIDVRRQQLAEHDHALHQREAGADAPTYSAAEGDPGVRWPGWSRRTAPAGTRRAPGGSPGGRGRCRIDGPDRHPRRQVDAADGGRRRQRAHHHRDHRVQAHRLLEHGLQPVVVPVVGRRGGPGQQRRRRVPARRAPTRARSRWSRGRRAAG